MIIQEVIKQIQELGIKYQQDNGITPHDICLGPVEFSLLWEEGRRMCVYENLEHHGLAPMYYQGMRIHPLSLPGIWVGTLISR